MGGAKASEAVVEFGADTGPLKRGLREATAEVTKTGKSWGGAFKLASVGIAGFVAAFVGFAAEGVKKADALDASIARIGAQTGMTATQVAELRKGLLEMSTRVPQGIDQLSKAIESVAKSGYNVADSLRIQEAAAKVATVTNTDLATVTNAVVTAMKGWNIGAKDVTSVTDTLITTVGRSRIDFDSLSRIIATAAPIAKDAGVSFNDLNAAIIAVGRSGLPARRAASGVLTLIRSLTSPAAQKQMAALGLHVDATTIKHKGLLATLQEIQKASGKHVEVLVKNKKGQVDWAKSIAATTKANTGSMHEMQVMVGGAAGLITANILLANGASDYKAAQQALNEKLGKTNEEFAKVTEADLGVQIDKIKNRVIALSIGIGTDLLPYVAKFVGWLADALPAALKAIGVLWDTYLKGPVTAMVSSFLGMADAVGKAFDIGAGGGGGLLGFFKTLAGVAGMLARDLAGVFDIVKSIFNSPIGGGVAFLLKAFIGLRLLVTGIPALMRGLTGKLLGGLNLATGGIFKLGSTAATTAGQSAAEKAALAPLTESGAAMTKAAEAHIEAAAALKEAAAVSRGGVVAGEAGAVTSGLVGAEASLETQKAENIAAESALVAKKDLATTEEADAAAAQTEAALAQREAAAAQLAAAEAQKLQPPGRVAGALGSAGGLMSGFIAKAFVPLLIGQIATEFLKAPIGDIIAGQPGFARAGALIKQDFFGGLVQLFTKSMQGADAAVGFADQTRIGHVDISTVRLAQLGIDSATIANLQSDNPVTVAVAAIDKAQGPLSADTQRKVGESVLDWYKRVKGAMSFPAGTQAAIDAILATGTHSINTHAAQGSTTGANVTSLTGAQEQQLSNLIASGLQADLSDIKNMSRAALITAITTVGQGKFTAGQISQLTTTQAATIGQLMSEDTTNQYVAVRDYLLHSYLDDLKKTPPSKRKNVPGERRIGASGGLATTVSGLTKEESMVQGAIDNYLKTVPEGVQAGVRKFAADVKGLPASLKAALAKKFGADWEITSMGAIAGLPEQTKKTKSPIAAALTKALGPVWRESFTGIGPLLAQSLGGPDAARLRKGLATAIAGVVGSLKKSDLAITTGTVNGTLTGSMVQTSAEAAKAKKTVQNYLDSTVGKGALQLATSPDAAQVKAGFKQLGDALARSIPDEGKRNAFIGTLVTLQKAGSAPYGNLKTAMDSLLSAEGVAGGVDSVATAIDRLGAAAAQFFRDNPALAQKIINANAPRPKTPPPGSHAGASAAGSINYASGRATSLTYGEVGTEMALVMRNPSSMSLRGLMGGLVARAPMPGGLSAPGGAGGGAHQSIYVDHMHVQSGADEQAILDTLEFMAPAGV